MQNEFTVGQVLEMWSAGIAMNVNDGRIKSVVFEALGRRTDVEENQRAYGAVDHCFCADDAGGRVCRGKSGC